jgi:hypothetical protein
VLQRGPRFTKTPSFGKSFRTESGTFIVVGASP